jgi:hypothetical protein
MLTMIVRTRGKFEDILKIGHNPLDHQSNISYSFSALWSLPLVEIWKGPSTNMMAMSCRVAELRWSQTTTVTLDPDPGPDRALEAVLGLDPTIASVLTVPNRGRDLPHVPGLAPSHALVLPPATGLHLATGRGPDQGLRLARDPVLVPGLALNPIRVAPVVTPKRRMAEPEMTQ